MSNWKREYGTDSKGNRTIVITENSQKPYVSLANRFQIACIKIVIGLGIFVAVIGKLGGIL